MACPTHEILIVLRSRRSTTIQKFRLRHSAKLCCEEWDGNRRLHAPVPAYMFRNAAPRVLDWVRRLEQRLLTKRGKRQSGKKMQKAEVEEDMCQSSSAKEYVSLDFLSHFL